MIRDILCDSNCIYQENGLCEKQNDVVMYFSTSLSYVICDDYIPRREPASLSKESIEILKRLP